jgi:hypothetical protein
VRNNDGGCGADNSALALSCSLLAHVTASIVAAQMMVLDNNGSRAEDGALSALFAVPCPLTQQQQQRQHRQMAAEWTTMPWHCWPFPALLHGGNDGSGTNNRRTYQVDGCVDEGALALLGIPFLHTQLRHCSVVSNDAG